MISNPNNKVIGKFIQFHEKLDSTNNEASKYNDSKLENNGLIIFAAEQTAGRGQREATWFSDKGKNLSFSIVLFPTFLKVKDYFHLTMAISNAIVKFLNKTYNLDAKIKWPNDIFVNEKKVGGILIETSIQGDHFQSAIVGIGLNLNQESFPENLPMASSIFIESNIVSDIKKTLLSLSTYLDNGYSDLLLSNYTKIKSQYLDQLFIKDIPWIFYKSDKSQIHGKIVDVQSDGKLIIEDKSGHLQGFYFKEISFF